MKFGADHAETVVKDTRRTLLTSSIESMNVR